MMSFSKQELTGIGITLAVVVLLFIGARWYTNEPTLTPTDTDRDTVVLPEEGTDLQSVINAMLPGLSRDGKVEELIIQDLEDGEGGTVEKGDTVSVHYVGMLQNGTEFDNSYNRGVPYTFTVGQGEVIEGWDLGILGMKEGGTRILIIPADLAYGNRSNSVIPPNSTLLFAVELVDIQ